MQQDRQRRGIRREHDELRGTAVQRLGGFVGALLELPVVRRLLNEVEDVLGERFVGDGPSYLFSSSVVAFKHVFFFLLLIVETYRRFALLTWRWVELVVV